MRKNKVLSLLLALALCLGMLPHVALAADSDFVIEDGVLVEYTGPGGDVVIPDGVTSIGISAFEGCTGLTGVTIPGSVTYIDDYAFRYCDNLTSLTFLDGDPYLTNYSLCTFVPSADGTYNSILPLTCTVYAPAGSRVEAYCTRWDKSARRMTFSALGEAAASSDGYISYTMDTFRYVVDEDHGILGVIPLTFEAAKTVKATVDVSESSIYLGNRENTYEVTLVLVAPNGRITVSKGREQTEEHGSVMPIPCNYLGGNRISYTYDYWAVDSLRNGDILTAEEFFGGGVDNTAFEALWVVDSPGEYNGEPRYYIIMPEDLYDGAASSSPTAYASTQTVQVDGKAVTFYAYALTDGKGGLTNYVKLRDVAAVLSGTPAQFEVGWDGSINLETGKAYTPVGGEMEQTFEGDQPYLPSDAKVNINGAPADLEAITLWNEAGTVNYFKLRDLGKALGFNVGWSADRGIFIESDKPYTDAD